MKIQVFGTGCARCRELTANVEAAAHDLGVEYQLEKVTDLQQIARAGVLITPALAIDGKLKLAGKVPTSAEIRQLLR